ncbi:MAG TPA: hypothetical protein DHW82_13820 [Spirochaetia bacterium]|nr:hypothetical protein [Spirochaetia bacterium]
MDKNISLIKKYWLYSKERFPILPVLLYSGAVFYAACFFVSFFGQPSFSFIQTLPGWATLFLVTLHLRLLDEHKDYEKDLKAHPDRLLSKGIISLKELRILFWIVLGIEILINAFWGISRIAFWGALFLWSLLMFKEFFIGKFLEKRIGLYLFSHQILVIFLGFYALSFFMDFNLFNPKIFPFSLLYLFGIMCFTMTYEIARKTWSHDREHEFADSYTKSWGIPGTFIITQIIALAAGGIFYYFLIAAGVSLVSLFIIGGSYFLFLLTEILFVIKPTLKNSKTLEISSMLFVLASLISSAVTFYNHSSF